MWEEWLVLWVSYFLPGSGHIHTMSASGWLDTGGLLVDSEMEYSRAFTQT